ncbi:unnamed protein product [Prorocentrum cordatum]|uniref:Beta-galactosidase n=1 Tax=Prorocentrum cordatum TaxID=2364126 RepID=A0ABN9VW90_9DINO|nr:unnamed protein product [Polarella glacialis]
MVLLLRRMVLVVLLVPEVLLSEHCVTAICGQGSKPAHHVEVRLEPPLNVNPPDGLYFIARLHSAADGLPKSDDEHHGHVDDDGAPTSHVFDAAGLSKYREWGVPQPLGIWADDVITVSIHAARTEAHFDRCKYEDVAELHLPWELVCRGAPAGEEMVFDLAMARGVPWLGNNALQGQYQERRSGARATR